MSLHFCSLSASLPQTLPGPWPTQERGLHNRAGEHPIPASTGQPSYLSTHLPWISEDYGALRKINYIKKKAQDEQSN